MTLVKLFISQRIIVDNKFINGGVLVGRDGKILALLTEDECKFYQQSNQIEIIDEGSNVLMPGIIDSHVHINEPGRTEWEGFETATKAAARGGITTIIDMPLNSIPPTTTLENFNKKIAAAKDQVYVDVGFWGGIIPGNENELIPLIKAGVVGFKSFMCPSGVDEFPNVNFDQIEKVFQKLDNTDTVLAFHAEIGDGTIPKGDPTHYITYLETRPPSMEVAAISEICTLSKKYNVKTHIVHLSAAEALPIIEKTKKTGAKLTVETCHHYLTLKAEEVPNGCTYFKCCPPIRDEDNQEQLWEGLKNKLIDMVVSDHSPCPPDLKCLETGDFLKAWGGISSLQFGLSLFWTNLKNRKLDIFEINKYLTLPTSKLVGLHRNKGKIALNYDADFVIWDPEAEFVVEQDEISHKNKLTPYLGMKLYGKIIRTVVRGETVFKNGEEFPEAKGKLLIKH